MKGLLSGLEGSKRLSLFLCAHGVDRNDLGNEERQGCLKNGPGSGKKANIAGDGSERVIDMKKPLLIRGWVTVLVTVLVLAVSVGWGQCPLADLTGDCVVDLADFAVLAGQWLDDGMTWVYIDDPCGVSGHEGFTGYMSKYETTNGHYCQYLNNALADGLVTVHNDIVYASDDTSYSEPYFTTHAASSTSQIEYSNGRFSLVAWCYDESVHPVVEVSWYGASAFAAYYGWRLPTEWEWQAVADYDGSYGYGCGTTISPSVANYMHAVTMCLPYTTAVGYYGGFGYGLADMAGNVYEWTDSWYTLDSTRVCRGGGWDSFPSNCAVDFRWGFSPEGTYDDVGFRVCRD